MHEWGLAVGLVRVLQEEAWKSGAARIKEVRLRLGSLSGVSPEAFRFGFQAAARGTVIDPDALVIEEVTARSRCQDCGMVFDDRDGTAFCPNCGSVWKELVEGREMVTESFVMEEANV